MNANYFRRYAESSTLVPESENPSVQTPFPVIAPRIPDQIGHAEWTKSRQQTNNPSIVNHDGQSTELSINGNNQSLKLLIKKPRGHADVNNYTTSTSEFCLVDNHFIEKNKSRAALNDSISIESSLKKASFSPVSLSHSSDSSVNQEGQDKSIPSRSPSHPSQNNEGIALFNQQKVFALTDIFMNHSAAEIFVPIPLISKNIPTGPVRLFQGLSDVLKKHYNSESIEEEDLFMKEPELKIFKAILTRKYNIKCFGPNANNNLISILKKVDNYKSSKRLEENYKFVLSRCIKHLKKQLPKCKHRKIRKREFDTYFYQYYFGDICQSTNSTISDFQIPRTSTDIVLKTKTISDEYIARLAQSKTFTEACVKYMESQLRIDYRTEMNFKIDKLIESWENTYKEAVNKDQAIDMIVNNIVHSQRFKLPWVGNEVCVAVESVRSIFNKYSSC